MSLESDLVNNGMWEIPAKLIAAAVALAGSGGGSGIVNVDGEPFTPPVLTDFTWVNQSGATATQRPGYVSLHTADKPGGDTLRLLVQPAPAAPYSATLRIGGVTSANYSGYGICMYDSVGGQILTVGTTGSAFHVSRWSSPTTYLNSALAGEQLNPRWFRMRDDGTNIYADLSDDGYSFANIWSSPRGGYLSGVPNQVGFYMHNVGSEGQCSAYSWKVE